MIDLRRVVIVAIGVLIGAGSLAAQVRSPQDSLQPLRLTISDVIRRADSASEAVAIARAGLHGANARVSQASSGWLPQLSGSTSYTRTLRSQFAALEGSGGSADDTIPAPVDCTRFIPNPALPIEERLDALERGLDCTANGGGGIDFSRLPFGRVNAWRFGLDLNQTILDRSLSARIHAAHAGEEQAAASYDAARAQNVLTAAVAYYDARLAAVLLEIADSTLAQATRVEQNTALAERVGNAAEFDLLRARVARQNQVPVVASRRSDYQVALIRLRQLLDIPENQPVELATELADTSAIQLPSYARGLRGDTTSVDDRAAVREATAAFEAASAQRDAMSNQRWPRIALTSSFAELAYPENALRFGSFLSDWTVGVQLSVPLFTGGRISGQVREAEAAAVTARLRLQQMREGAMRDRAEADTRLEAAVAAFVASTGTVDEARRAYQIAELRVREGISTLTDLGAVRVQLQQSEVNRAQAARDLQVARLRRRLLRDLPVSPGGASTTGPSSAASFQVPVAAPGAGGTSSAVNPTGAFQ